MSRGRGRPTKLDSVAVDRIRELRAQGASYAVIARDLKVTKRTILNWIERGRTDEAGLHREVRLALVGREEVAPPPRSPPTPITAIESATIRITDGGWRREDRAVTLEELQHLRELSERRTCQGFDEALHKVEVEVCRPMPEAKLTLHETELVDGLLHLTVLDSRHQTLRIEFLPRDAE